MTEAPQGARAIGATPSTKSIRNSTCRGESEEDPASPQEILQENIELL
ncbi:hypothetical protein Tco_0463731, partial [Tanacetum coccineum]